MRLQTYIAFSTIPIRFPHISLKQLIPPVPLALLGGFGLGGLAGAFEVVGGITRRCWGADGELSAFYVMNKRECSFRKLPVRKITPHRHEPTWNTLYLAQTLDTPAPIVASTCATHTMNRCSATNKRENERAPGGQAC